MILFAYLNRNLSLQTLSNSTNLNVPGYNMSRANHLSCNRCRGVCIYYKESLPPEVFNIHYLLEFICFYLNIGNKTFNIISFYRSPSETAYASDKFLTNLNLPLESVTKKNPFYQLLLVVLMLDYQNGGLMIGHLKKVSRLITYFPSSPFHKYLRN